MIEATIMLRAHEDARSALRNGASLALAVPSSLDVLTILHRCRVVASRNDVLEAARVLRLPLADAPDGAAR